MAITFICLVFLTISSCILSSSMLQQCGSNFRGRYSEFDCANCPNFPWWGVALLIILQTRPQVIPLSQLIKLCRYRYKARRSYSFVTLASNLGQHLLQHLWCKAANSLSYTDRVFKKRESHFIYLFLLFFNSAMHCENGFWLHSNYKAVCHTRVFACPQLVGSYNSPSDAIYMYKYTA